MDTICSLIQPSRTAGHAFLGFRDTTTGLEGLEVWLPPSTKSCHLFRRQAFLRAPLGALVNCWYVLPILSLQPVQPVDDQGQFPTQM